MTSEQGQSILNDHVKLLKEHFQNVQVLVSSADENSTTTWEGGSGNLLARVAHAEQWTEEIRGSIVLTQYRRGDE
jgi:hypothetical protein